MPCFQTQKWLKSRNPSNITLSNPIKIPKATVKQSKGKFDPFKSQDVGLVLPPTNTKDHVDLILQNLQNESTPKPTFDTDRMMESTLLDPVEDENDL